MLKVHTCEQLAESEYFFSWFVVACSAGWLSVLVVGTSTFDSTYMQVVEQQFSYIIRCTALFNIILVGPSPVESSSQLKQINIIKLQQNSRFRFSIYPSWFWNLGERCRIFILPYTQWLYVVRSTGSRTRVLCGCIIVSD